MRIAVVCPIYWPASIVGALRITAWTRLWARHPEDEILVLTRRYPEMEPDGQENLDSSIAVHHLTTSYPSRRAAIPSALGWLRLWAARTILVPDVSRRTWDRLQDDCVGRIDEFGADIVLTTSPPHAIHVVGEQASRRLGVPWVADFRDPYLDSCKYGANGVRKLRSRAHSNFEWRVYSEASRVVHTHELHHERQLARYPWAADRMMVIPNGVPTASLDELSKSFSSDNGPPRRIVSIGSCGSQEFLALAGAVSRLDEDIVLEHAGRSLDVAEMASTMLGPRLRIHGLLPHAMALRLIASADILALPQTGTRRTMISSTSRLPEFMATGKPVLTANAQLGDYRLLREYYPKGYIRVEPPTDVVAWEQAIVRGLSGDVCASTSEVQRVQQVFSREIQADLVRNAMLQVLRTP
jgi:glycosyltransferase involved in cell wall biosynthesis